MNERPAPPPPTTSPFRPKLNWKALACGGCLTVLTGTFILLVIGVSSLFQGVSTFSSSYPDTIEEVIVEEKGDDKIAIIDLHGMILTDEPYDGNATSATAIHSMLEKAAQDETVKAVLLDIDSPGGTVVGSRQIYESLQSFSKPVLAFYSGELAASGGVYASMGADKIISYPDTITGSIGVVAEFLDLSKLLETYGVGLTTIKSGQYKDIGSPARSMTDLERRLIQDLIDESYAQFVRVIMENRQLSETEVKAFADGRIFSGTHAYDLRLVDGVGDRELALSETKKLAGLTEATLVRYESSGLGSILGLFSEKLGSTDWKEVLLQNRRATQFQLLYALE